MEKRIDQFAKQVNSDFTSINGALNTMVNGLSSIKGGGYVAAIAALGVAGVTVASQIHEMNLAIIESEKALRLAATQAKLSTDEMQNISAVTGTVGISLEKMGDLSKDVYDKLGDYITTGGGAFQDFVDVVGEGSKVTAESLQKMSSIEVLQAMVKEMERVGASSSQMTFVMESMASDSSHLLPLLEDGAEGFKRLKDRIDDLATTEFILPSTSEEILYLDEASKRFWENFKVYAAESIAGSNGMLSGMMETLNNFFAEKNKENRTYNFQLDYLNGGKVNASASADEARERSEALKDYAEIYDYDVRSARIRRKIAALEKARASGSLNAIERAMLGNAIELQEDLLADLKKEQPAMDANKAKALEVADAWARVAESKENAEKAGGLIGKENLAKISSVKTSDSDSELANQRDTSLSKIDEYRAKALQSQNEIKLLEERIRNEKNEAVKKSLEKELDLKERQRSDEIKAQTAHADKVLKIDETLAKRKLDAQDKIEREAKAAQEEAWRRELSLAQHKVNLAAEGEDKILAQKELSNTRYDQLLHKGEISEEIHSEYVKQLEASTQEALTNLVVQGELNRLQAQADSAITGAEQAQANYDLELAQLNQKLEDEKITKSQYDDLHFKALLAKHSAEYEANAEAHLNEHYATVAREEAKLAFLQESLDKEHLEKEQHRALELESKRALQEAKNAITMAELDGMAAAVGGLAQYAEEGSKQQKALILAEKSAAIASLSIQQWEKWGSAETWGEKAAVIAAYTGALASVASVTVGQFHSGSDEVDQTGSYILKQGERVIQPSANKDLTAYLEGNKKGSNSSTIKSDLVIQGDTTISDAKFQAMLVAHRENLTQAMKLAQRENPSLR